MGVELMPDVPVYVVLIGHDGKAIMERGGVGREAGEVLIDEVELLPRLNILEVLRQRRRNRLNVDRQRTDQAMGFQLVLGRRR